MNIKTVTVIGANGTLGIGVSGIFASFGNAEIYMVARSLEKAEKAIEKSAMSVKAHSITRNMKAKTYEDLKKCIENSDVIVEAVAEDYKIKKEIHKQINEYMKKEAISTTVTSGISINKLAECYSEENRKKFIGMHFFNPPYSLQLCELIASEKTDIEVENKFKEYLEKILYRKVIKTKDKPAFLANRIGFQFINKTMQLAEKYKNDGGIDYIDTILGCFTGRNMPPLYTADFVRIRCT